MISILGELACAQRPGSHFRAAGGRKGRRGELLKGRAGGARAGAGAGGRGGLAVFQTETCVCQNELLKEGLGSGPEELLGKRPGC